MWMRLLKDNVIIVVVIHYGKQRWIYGLCEYTHWTYLYLCIICNSLDKLHLSFSKHCNTFVMTCVENEQKECITFCATPFLLRLNNYCYSVIELFHPIIIFKWQETRLFMQYTSKHNLFKKNMKCIIWVAKI